MSSEVRGQFNSNNILSGAGVEMMKPAAISLPTAVKNGQLGAAGATEGLSTTMPLKVDRERHVRRATLVGSMASA